MALRAKLKLRFDRKIYAENFSHFVDSLKDTNEFRLAGLTFIDTNDNDASIPVDSYRLEIHDAQTGCPTDDKGGQFWTMGDLSCDFEGDDEIVDTAQKVYEYAREYFAPIKHPAF